MPALLCRGLGKLFTIVLGNSLDIQIRQDDGVDATRRTIGAVVESSTVCPALRAVHPVDAAGCGRREQACASLRR